MTADATPTPSATPLAATGADAGAAPGTAPLLLHVGYHKTATTWLQDRLLRPAHGFRQMATHQEVSDLVERPTDLTFDPAPMRELLARRLADPARLASGEVPVVSSEILSGHPFQGGRDGAVMARRLASIVGGGAAGALGGRGARILVSIRAQGRILPSVYMQYLQRGGTMPPARFFEGTTRPGYFGFDPAHFEYDRLVGLYQELFGRAAVHVMTQESLRRDMDAAARALAAFAGARFDALEPADRAVRSASYPEHAIGLLRRANHLQTSTLNPVPVVALGRTPKGLFRLAGGVMRRPPLSRWLGGRRPATEAARRFDGRWGASNARLAAMVAHPLDLTGYETAAPADAGADAAGTGLDTGAEARDAPAPTRRAVAGAAAGLLAAPFLARPAGAQGTDRAAALARALAETRPGGTLELPPGEWGTLELRGPGPGTIRSADPGRPAVLTGLVLRDARGLTLEALALDYRWTRGERVHYRPFRLEGAQGVRLRGLRISGDVAGRGARAEDRGFPTGMGLLIDGCRDVAVERCAIARFHRGILIRESAGVSVRGCDLQDLRSDGIDVLSTRGVAIEGNHLHDFSRNVDSRDHADMIQFWTRNATRPTTDVRIRDNVLNSGNGAFSQSIFMRNEAIGRQGAGPSMLYRDVEISGNVVINAHSHGIAVSGVRGLAIRDNTLVHNPRSAGPRPTRKLWMPRVRVGDDDRDVVVERNIAAAFPEPRPGWRMDRNLAVQPHALMEPGHYGRVFVGGDPTRLESYRPRPDGPGAGLGAPRLRRG